MLRYVALLSCFTFCLHGEENPYQKPSSLHVPKGLITPPVAPRIEKGYNLFLDGDFIWWKTTTSNLDFGQVGSGIATPSFKYAPGFKAGLGMDLHHDGWDTYAEYTWVHPPLTQDTFAEGSFNFLTQENGFLYALPFDSMLLKRKSHFHILDLEVGRNFFISKYLTLRPNIGFKLANLYEREKVSVYFPSKVKYIFKQNIDGIGVRAGLDTVWHLTPSFGFYGDVAITPLFSHFHDEVSNPLGLFIEKSFEGIIPVLEAGIGLVYTLQLCHDRFQIYSKLGFEEQVYFNYNQQLISGLGSSSGTLSMEGLTLKVGFIF